MRRFIVIGMMTTALVSIQPAHAQTTTSTAVAEIDLKEDKETADALEDLDALIKDLDHYIRSQNSKLTKEQKEDLLRLRNELVEIIKRLRPDRTGGCTPTSCPAGCRCVHDVCVGGPCSDWAPPPPTPVPG